MSKDTNIIIRCTSDEKQAWEKKCADLQLDFSKFIRNALDSYNPTSNRDLSDFERIERISDGLEKRLTEKMETIIETKMKDLIDTLFTDNLKGTFKQAFQKIGDELFETMSLKMDTTIQQMQHDNNEPKPTIPLWLSLENFLLDAKSPLSLMDLADHFSEINPMEILKELQSHPIFKEVKGQWTFSS